MHTTHHHCYGTMGSPAPAKPWLESNLSVTLPKHNAFIPTTARAGTGSVPGGGQSVGASAEAAPAWVHRLKEGRLSVLVSGNVHGGMTIFSSKTSRRRCNAFTSCEDGARIEALLCESMRDRCHHPSASCTLPYALGADVRDVGTCRCLPPA